MHTVPCKYTLVNKKPAGKVVVPSQDSPEVMFCINFPHSLFVFQEHGRYS